MDEARLHRAANSGGNRSALRKDSAHRDGGAADGVVVVVIGGDGRQLNSFSCQRIRLAFFLHGLCEIGFGEEFLALASRGCMLLRRENDYLTLLRLLINCIQ